VWSVTIPHWAVHGTDHGCKDLRQEIHSLFTLIRIDNSKSQVEFLTKKANPAQGLSQRTLRGIYVVKLVNSTENQSFKK